MDQGDTKINGPHQGAWVSTQTHQDWFLHFQDKGVYGRVMHLEPMKWINDWPVIGIDKDQDGKGEPVTIYKKPDVGKAYPAASPQETDEFNGNKIGLQWQWMANPAPTWAFANIAKGTLTLFSYVSDSAKNLWFAPNVLLQKFPAEEFMATAKMTFNPNMKLGNEKAGLTVMGVSYANIALANKSGENYLVYTVCSKANEGNAEKENIILKTENKTVFLRIAVKQGGICTFSYSMDAKVFTSVGESFQAKMGRWIGAKVGIFCTRKNTTNDSGYADFDWFRIEKNQ